MTFQINGSSGKYDNKINDESIRYGKNAVDNHVKYLQVPIANDSMEVPPIFDFAPNSKSQEDNLVEMEKYVNANDAYLNSLPPLEYEYRYMPNVVNGKINQKALFAASEEEMGKKPIPVKEFENLYLPDDSMTAEPLDINKDGKIDIAEYSTTTLAADILGKGTTDVSKVDGVVNIKGLNAVLEYSKKSNAVAASKLYSEIYNTYNLGSALNQV